MSNESKPHDETSINSKAAIAALFVLMAGSYLIAGAFIAEMHMSNFQRTSALFAGMTLGYAISGRVLGVFLRRFTGWPQQTCILVGSFLAHGLGASFAVWFGRMLAT